MFTVMLHCRKVAYRPIEVSGRIKEKKQQEEMEIIKKASDIEKKIRNTGRIIEGS